MGKMCFLVVLITCMFLVPIQAGAEAEPVVVRQPEVTLCWGYEYPDEVHHTIIQMAHLDGSNWYVIEANAPAEATNEFPITLSAEADWRFRVTATDVNSQQIGQTDTMIDCDRCNGGLCFYVHYDGTRHDPINVKVVASSD